MLMDAAVELKGRGWKKLIDLTDEEAAEAFSGEQLREALEARDAMRKQRAREQKRQGRGSGEWMYFIPVAGSILAVAMVFFALGMKYGMAQ